MSTRGHSREVGRGRMAGEAREVGRGRMAGEAQPDYDDDEDDDWGDLGGERDDLTDVPGGVRLQKVLAAAGVGSRRHCEELIGAGRVEVDGQTVRRFGARVDPEHQIIRVDGKRIPARQDIVYLAFNKPPKVLTAMSDDRGRKTVADFLGDRAERLFHVGRLDYDTEGLMLLTNDGELAHRLAHPSYEVAKTYLADVPGPASSWRTGWRSRTGSGCLSRPARTPSWRSPCTRAASTSSAGCSLRSGTRSAVSSAPRWDRSSSAACGPARPATSPPGKSASSTPPSACRRQPVPSGQGKELSTLTVRAIRGAIQLDATDRDAILEGTAELVAAVMSRNDLAADDVISVLFTVTPDLTAEFPALAARKTGFHAVPLMCATEIPVPGAMPRVVRLMAHVDTDRPRSEIQHVYLRGAAALRLDIAQ